MHNTSDSTHSMKIKAVQQKCWIFTLKVNEQNYVYKSMTI